jgi:chromosome segregation ATPase
MSKTAKITAPTEVTEQPLDTPLEPQAAAIPTIEPHMAQVLELVIKNHSSVTPREINDHLSRILHSYDALTAQYGQNSLRIEAELNQLRQAGGSVSGQLQQINAALNHQSEAVAGLAVSTTADLQSAIAAQNQLHQQRIKDITDSEVRSQLQTTDLETRIYQDVARLDSGLHAVEKLLDQQTHIIGQQSQRLDQFDIAYELLDTATRGNRTRIETVREKAEQQQAILSAQVQGLSALQREHYAEFNDVRGWVGVLQTQAQQLDERLHTVTADLSHHVQTTRRKFHWTHAGLGALLLLTATGFALVKWSPALTPEHSLQAQAQSDQQIVSLQTQLPTLQQASVAQSSQIAQLESTLNALKANVGELRRAVGTLGTRVSNTEAVALTQGAHTGGIGIQDANWVLQQSPANFTVQLMGAERPQDMAAFVRQNAALLADASMSYTVTQPQGRSRYNLFYGIFTSSDAARAAIDSFPDTLRTTKPWVRQLSDVQGTVR